MQDSYLNQPALFFLKNIGFLSITRTQSLYGFCFILYYLTRRFLFLLGHNEDKVLDTFGILFD